MTQWQPEQQISALKYGAYTVLACCLIFISGLVREILATLPDQSSTVPNVLAALSAIALIVVVVRWSKEGYGSGGWREIFGLYSEEFARDLNRKASTYACLAMLVLLLLACTMGDPVLFNQLGASVRVLFSLSNFSAVVLLVAGIVWAFTVLLNLREEAED
ncbi:hypothetical protein [Rheinheimera sp.]|uniref:hypothetical protein n=1 Tax=Rheinheimera sp. TaxID=1869214 RepID=UPI00261B317E|nr:hypothetical protein [Rheinheimera sp.]MCA1929267.1 hypothetical protein [Rheinheimera sp.]